MARMGLGPPSLAALQHICRRLRARDLAECRMLDWNHEPDALALRLYQAWGRSFIAQVASADAEPVAVMMLTWHTPRVLAAALLATERWPEIARPFARHALKTLKPRVIAQGVNRVECRTWVLHRDVTGFLEFLGARAETVLPGYGAGGETFVQYAWTRPDLHPLPDLEAGNVQDAQGAGLKAAAYTH